MVKIKPPSLAARIDAIDITQERRPHLGGSQIGHKCSRYLWYSFHWAYKNDIGTKLNRIFRLGDAIEDLIVADLDRIGLTVTDSQKRVVGYKGHAGGSIDGVVDGKLFEAKSMNVTSYNKLKKGGSVEECFPVYYAQVQYYMGYLGLKEALFVSMNKNTQELYIEEIPYDLHFFKMLQVQEKQIIDTADVDEFTRIGYNASWHECRFCSATDICHSGGEMERNCRTCKLSKPVDNGAWVCDQEFGTMCSEYV
jgi:hypothetical protein